MKLTTVFIIASLLQVSAASYAQRLTYKNKQASLEQIFREIRKQTGYNVLVSDTKIQGIQPQDVNFSNTPLEEVLNKVLQDKPLTYDIEDKTILIKEKYPSLLNKLKTALAIPIDITGVVQDTTKAAIKGATITIKPKGTRAFTDDDGAFAIKADSGDSLIVTFIGYKTQRFLIDQNSTYFRIVLHDDQTALKEVVVNTGYERISKERATGAFDYIDQKKLNEQVGANILDRLNGTASSVIFDKTHSGGTSVGGPNRVGFNIRGLSTINGDPTPLIVVDNFPYDGDITNINPNDVQSITILKDAAAASIWGVRAGNGVVVITTKKGNFNQKVKVEFNANLTTSQKPDLMYLPQMSSSDYIDVEKFLFSKGEYNNAEIDPNHSALSPVIEQLIAARDGKITQEQADAQIDRYRNHDVRNDYLKYVYRNPFNQQYALNLSGGTNNATYYISGGYDKNVDNLSAKNDRVTLRTQTTFKPAKGLQISAGLNYIQSKTQSGKQSYGSIHQPYISLVDASGKPLAVVNRYRQPFIDTLGQGKLLDWNYYPLTDWEHSVTRNLSTDLLGKINLQYNIISGLNAEVNYQYERQTSTSNNLNDLDSYYARDLINSFTDFTASNPEGTVYPVPIGGILILNNGAIETQNIRGQLNYNKTWNKHSITALAGAEVREQVGTSDDSRTYGYIKDPYSTQVVKPLTAYYTAINGSYAIIPTGTGIGPVSNNRFVSVFANAAYTYDERYTVSGSMRRDATNVFGVNTNNKWKPLWSSGLAWNIDKESFFNSDILSFLKLRTTYGYSGNINPNATALSILYYGGRNSYSQLPNANTYATSNPNLRWEQIRTINLGLDFGLKNGILNGSVDYYDKKGTDLFGPAQVDVTTGNNQGTIIKNVANMHGQGVDFVLNTKNIDRDIKWFSSLLFNYNIEKVTKYFLASNTTNVNASGGISPRVGEPLYSVITYKSAGLDAQTGNPKFILNGNPSMDYAALALDTNKNDLSFHGSATPRFYGAISNTISWKNLSLNFNITYKFDYYFVRNSINYNSLVQGGSGNSDYENRWQKPGDEKMTTVPSFAYPLPNDQRYSIYNASDVLVEKGDHIRLQYVNLSYNLTKEKLKSMPFQNLSLYLNANNLWILWRANKKGIDPDVNNTSYPNPKTISLGLRGNF